jgi:hypothetical protein
LELAQLKSLPQAAVTLCRGPGQRLGRSRRSHRSGGIRRLLGRRVKSVVNATIDSGHILVVGEHL